VESSTITSESAPEALSDDYEYEEDLGPDPYRVFFIRRIRRAQIRAPYLFNFFSQGTLIYSAKTRQVLTDTVYISESPSVHIKAQQYDWILRVSKGQCVFELFNKAGDDQEIYIRITNDCGKPIGPRKFQIDISPDVHLHSKVAVLSRQGK
jgi:hypothetical protein